MESTSGVQAGVLSTPSGGGALRSLGESFQPDLLRGSGNYSVPIDLPAGANEQRPALSLRYSTGQGNGPFGMGWQLSTPPSIMRSTDDGIPRYDDRDALLLGGDALVDVGAGRFRPRSDTQFWDVRREGDGWRIRTEGGARLPPRCLGEQQDHRWRRPGPGLAVRATARPGRQRDRLRVPARRRPALPRHGHLGHP